MNVPLELSQVAAATGIETARPRVMIAGEFSAGKTRLVNALLGEPLLPSAVTSTSLPAVWISHGAGQPECVALDGQATAFASVADLLAHLQRTDPETIHHCRIFHASPALLAFDLIDTPGSSDPNIASLAWERIVPHADLILWCSNAVQAWRQSEKSAWSAIPAEIAAQSHLVLSQADRLTDPIDREKLLRRVRHEAGGLFAAIHLASFLSPEDTAALQGVVTAAVQSLALRPARPFPRGEGPAVPAPDAPARIAPRRIRVRPAPGKPLLLVPAPQDEAPKAASVPATAPNLDQFVLRAAQTPPPAEPKPAAPETSEDFLALLRDAIDAAEVEETTLAPTEPATAPAPRPEAEAETAPLEDLVAGLLRASPPAEPVAAALPEPAPEPLPEPVPAAALPVQEAAPAALPRPAIAAVTTPEPETPPVARTPAEPAPAAVAPLRQPAAAPVSFGPARMLWARILPTLDLDDPDSLLDGIEQLVSDLDTSWAQAAFAQTTVRRRRGASD